MAQDNNAPDDAQEAYAAYQAYKAHQAQNAGTSQQPGGAFMDETRKFIRGEDSPMWNQMSNDAMMMAGGNTINKAASVAPALKSFFGRTATNTGIGGASGAMRPVQEGETRTGNTVKGAAFGAGASLAGDAIGATARKLADWLQTGAVGMKGNPGEGNKLVDMGIRGSRAGMGQQVENVFNNKEGELQNLVKSTYGPEEPSSNMAEFVRSRNLPRFQMEGGKANPNVQPEVDQINQFSDNLKNISPGFSNKDYLDLKRQGDWPGYTAAQTKAASLEGQLGRSQGDFSRARLDANTQGESSRLLGDEGTLIKAGTALGKEYKEGLVPSLITAKTGIPRSITRGVMAQFGAPIESYTAAGLQKGVEPVASSLGQNIPLSMLLHQIANQK